MFNDVTQNISWFPWEKPIETLTISNATKRNKSQNTVHAIWSTQRIQWSSHGDVPHNLFHVKIHSTVQVLNSITEEDSIHQLDRAAPVTIFRLRTGHCQLLSHLHRLKISHSDECPCSTGPQTPNHILQSCPTFDDLRRQTWPSPVEAHRKLWGPVETLQQTADFALLTGLKI